MQRIWVKAGALAAIVTVAIGIGPAAAQPGPLRVRSNGEAVNATLGSSCWTEDGHGFCSDAIYPLRTHGKLPVAGGDLVRIRTAEPARRVTVELVQARGNDFRSLKSLGRARRSGDSRKKWRIRLPQSLGDATILDVFVRYPQGDGDFWAGLKKQ
jgi:hypothetical protein